MATWRPATADDPLLAALSQLDANRQRDDLVIIEGEIATCRALEAGWPVKVVLATEAHARRLPALPAGAHGLLGSPRMLEAVAGFAFHRGCLAVAGRPRSEAPASRLRALADGRPSWTIVVAEALADPVNVGALVRNARAFAALAVVLVGGADPLSARAVRASMGHVFAMPVVSARDLADALDPIAAIARDACVVAAATGADARPIDAVVLPPRRVLLVGAEGPGLSAEALARAHVQVTIPTAIDSLNVAAATAVLLYALAQGS